LKPENILITPKGIAKLADMGLAKVAVAHKVKTERGLIVGTPWYLSPEQATGEEELDCRADIYSLGITFYQLLTNEVPFDGDSAAVVMTKHIIEPLPSIYAKNQKISEGLCDIVKKMAAKDKKNRYQNPMELIKVLEDHRRPPPSASNSVTSILNLDVLEPPRSALNPRSSEIEKDRFRFCYIPTEEDVWFAKIALKNKVLTPIQIKKAMDYQERQFEIGLKDTLAFFLMDEEMITLKQKKIMSEVLEKILWKEKQGGFERVVLKNKWVPEETMKKIMAHLEQTPNSSLIEFLTRKNLISSAQKQQLLLEEQKNSNAKIDGFLAQALVDCKFCKYDQIQETLESQKLFFQNMQQVKSIGSLLIEKGYLQEDQLQSILRAYYRKEITQQSIKELLDEKRKIGALDSTSSSKANTKAIASSGGNVGGGLFDNIRFAKASNDFCPYCESELVFGATSCRECGKSVK
ncbi:MAG: serine/threonine-protein kinase, partial [Planctomycetota bacterium]